MCWSGNLFWLLLLYLILRKLASFCCSPESVIKRFEQRDHAVDSRGVAEYLRALVVTNGIAEYLPDEQTGRTSSLPTLVNDFHALCLPNN